MVDKMFVSGIAGAAGRLNKKGEKSMKKMFKYFAAVLTAALLCLALVGCGSGTKYTFTDAKATTDASGGMLSQTITITETAYNAAYANSTIEVKDSEIVWTFGEDQSGTMSYTKDGDRYVLSGDFTKTLSQSLSSSMAGLGGVAPTIAFYGQETESGFEIVIDETFTGVPVMSYFRITFNFAKA